jgi:hypothetical protein
LHAEHRFISALAAHSSSSLSMGDIKTKKRNWLGVQKFQDVAMVKAELQKLHVSEESARACGLFREEPRTESPNRDMTVGAVHQAGSQRVTVTHLMHPWPTVDMGWDKGSFLPLIQSKEVRANVLFDWNKEFQPSSIHVTAPHCAKSADTTGDLPTDRMDNRPGL